MRTSVRRSLVLATLLALLLGVAGPATPTVLGGSADEHQGGRHRCRRDHHPRAPVPDGPAPVEGGPARPVLPPPDLEARPEAQRGHHRQPDRPRRGTQGRRRPPQGRPSTPPRHPGDRQGQRQHDRDADHRRLVGPRRLDPVRCLHRQAAEGGRGDHHRQGEPLGVGELPVRIRPRAAGAGSAARPTWPTSSIATRAARARAPPSPCPRTSRPSASGPRPTARSSARPGRMASSASSRRSGSGVAQASSRSRPTRTPPARWPAT